MMRRNRGRDRLRALPLGIALLLAATLAACGGTAPPSVAHHGAYRFFVSGRRTAHLSSAALSGGRTFAAVSFLSPATGFAAGTNCASSVCRGLVRATTDGGREWLVRSAPPEALQGIQFLSPQVGYVWGRNALYRTDDGGRTWTRIATGPFGFVRFVSPGTGWVGIANGGDGCATQGYPFVVRSTTDGGTSWRRVAEDVLPGLGAPAFHILPWAEYSGGGAFSARSGYVYTSVPIGTVLRTTDAGAHFTGTLPFGASPQLSVSIAPSGRGWAFAARVSAAPGSGTPVYRTTDGGATWVRSGSVPGYWNQAVTAPSDGSLWLLGMGDGSGRYATAAAFTQLPHAAKAPRGESFSALDALDARSAYAVELGPEGGSIVRTSDGGGSWREVLRADLPPVPAGPISFWTGADGWAFGSAAAPEQLLATSDGGRGWRVAGSLPEGAQPLYGAAAGSGRGWLFDTMNRFWTTADGGRHWSQVPAADLPGGIGGIFSTGAASGYALIPSDGGIDRTTDGFRHWTPAQSGVRAAACSPGGGCWVLTQSGSLARRSGMRLDTAVRRVPGNFVWVGVPPEGGAGVWLWDPAEGLLAVSTNSGRSFAVTTLPPNLAGGVTGDPVITGPESALLEFADGLYATHDGGRTWRQLLAVPPV